MFKSIVNLAVTYVVSTLGQTVGETLYTGLCIVYDNFKQKNLKGQ